MPRKSYAVLQTFTLDELEDERELAYQYYRELDREFQRLEDEYIPFTPGCCLPNVFEYIERKKRAERYIIKLDELIEAKKDLEFEECAKIKVELNFSHITLLKIS